MYRSLFRRLVSTFSALTLATAALVAVDVTPTGAAPGTVGVDWQSQTTPGAGVWESVAYGEGKCDTANPTVVGPCFVAVGRGTPRVMTSPDGVTWTERTAADTSVSWYSVAYGNGMFVAVAVISSPQSGKVMTSPDGVTWTLRTPAVDYQWQSVAYGQGKCDTANPMVVGPCFVAVAQSGAADRVMTSPDGIVWTSRAAAAANQWRSVTYGNGMFVAVSITTADGGRVMTSTDGILWTLRTAAAANPWNSVTYGGGRFVAVATSGANRVMTSTDGIAWTSPMQAVAANVWRAVTYGGGLFVAVSSDGTNRVMTSTDGQTWAPQTAAAAESWFAVTYGGGRFIAVSTGGVNRAMVSPPPPPGPLSFSSGAFGSTVVGTKATLTVTVTNPANVAAVPSALTVAGTEVSRPAGAVGGTCAVSTPIAKSNGTCTVVLEWTPSTVGSLTGASLTIAYPWGTNASDTLTLTGASTATPEPGPMTFSSGTFGSVVPNATAALTVTVTNSGTAAATLGQPSVTGTDVTLTGGTCASGAVVAASATCTVELEWAPVAVGMLTSASLTVPYSGGTNPSDTLTLTGTAGSSPSPTGGLDRPRPVLVTITLVPGEATTCAGGHVRAGYVGEWLSLPVDADCVTNPQVSRHLLGWSTSESFPLAVAQRQAAFGWGTYIIDDHADQPVVVYIPVGWQVLLTGSNTLYPIWSA